MSRLKHDVLGKALSFINNMAAKKWWQDFFAGIEGKLMYVIYETLIILIH